MLTILFNLSSQPPSLIAGFVDFQLEIAAYVGYGDNPSLWTALQTAELDRDVQEAYRYILYPSRIPGGGLSHVWSWLRQTTTLTTVNGIATYTLPSDFGSLHGRYVNYAANVGFTQIKPTSSQDIRCRNQQSSQTAQPWLYAMDWAPQAMGTNQRQRIIFYPTPDAAYVLTYEYAVLIGKLSQMNPYPLGGPRMSQVMIEACKAVGEAKKNGQRGDQWSIFREELGNAIAMDSATNTERTVGPMVDFSQDRFRFGVRSVVGSVYAGVG